ncbi:MAG: DUF1540 domain-containing protein [Thioalkalispiraceae bacterium]|jgi:hypothetical protein
MKMTIDMPLVETCTVSDCGYNKADKCHARAITIGDGIHPGCDTSFLGAPSRTHANTMAGVGACKITGCSFNDDLECNADSISVKMQDNSIQCMTYQAG